MTMSHGRRLRAHVLIAALAAALALVIGPAMSASAAVYQYWGYFQNTTGTWSVSQKGSDQTVPTDGSVEGWRFGLDEGTGPRQPRVIATFDQLCSGTAAAEGKKRVGVILDSGRDVDGDGKTTPPALVATCVSVPTAATGTQVLAAAATTRVDKGMICAINGYPATGCGSEVAALTEAQKAADTPLTLPTKSAAPTTSAATAPATQSSGMPWLLLAGILVLAGLVWALVGRARGRRTV